VSGRVPNWATPESKSEALPFPPICSVILIWGGLPVSSMLNAIRDMNIIICVSYFCAKHKETLAELVVFSLKVLTLLALKLPNDSVSTNHPPNKTVLFLPKTFLSPCMFR
jgi:hypothetical protein